MEKQHCPDCGAENHPKSVTNDIREFRCANCGMVYYTPEGCRTEPSEADKAKWARDSEGMNLPSS